MKKSAFLPGGRFSAFSALVFCLAFSSFAQAQNFNLFMGELLYSDHYDGRRQSSDSNITLVWVNAWDLGDNYFFADFGPLDNYDKYGGIYAEWAPRISMGKAFGDGPLNMGLVNDIFVMGELNHADLRNTGGGTNTTRLMGFSVDLNLPGFAFFKVHAEGRDDPDLKGSSEQVTLVWNYPFALGGNNFVAEGFLDYATSEGSSSSNLLMQPQFTWQVNNKLNVGVEYHYWRNKFGVEGLDESAIQALIRWTF